MGKISDLAEATAMATTDVMVLNAGATTKKITVANLGVEISAHLRRRVLAQSGEAISHTGDTDETTLVAVAIAANLPGLNGSILIHSVWSCTNSGNNKIFRTRLGASGDAATHAGTAYGSLTFTTIATYTEIRKITNRNSASSQVGMVAALTSGLGASGSALVTSAIDTTAAAEIEFSAQLASADETITLESYLVELIQSQ